MAQVLLFHHAHGLTSGVQRFAERLRAAGHTVHVPDLYDGLVFADLDQGLAHARQTGFDTLLERARRAVEALPAQLVYVGASLGVMPAQLLAQTRAGATGAVLLHGCLPPDELGEGWPQDVPVQVHGMDTDPLFTDDGDLDAARGLAASTRDAELFLYPGEQHLFTDDSLPAYDEPSTALVLQRVLELLDRVDSRGRAERAEARAYDLR